MTRAHLKDLESEITYIDAALDILDPDNALESQWIAVYSARLDAIIFELERIIPRSTAQA